MHWTPQPLLNDYPPCWPVYHRYWKLLHSKPPNLLFVEHLVHEKKCLHIHCDTRVLALISM